MRIDADLQPSPLPVPEVAEKAVFTGHNADFRWLVTKGALLELVTVGFYRFWLATGIRRHLWGCTFLGGDPLEYLGAGRELLFGFFFALTILAPVYLAYFLLGVEAERYKAFASAPLGMFFFAFTQFALYRARRYRLHRTAWRGLRFGMGGSGAAYARRAILWSFAVFLSLGLALPWAEAALERYKMKHSFYGALQGSFVGRGRDLFARGWWIWFSAIFFTVLYFAVVSRLPDPLDDDADFGWVDGLAEGGGAVALWIAAVFFYGAYKSILWKWRLEGVRIGEIRAVSSLGLGALISNYWKYIGVTFLLILGYAVLVALSLYLSSRMGVRFELRPGGKPPVGLVAAIAGFYVVFLLSIGVVWRIYFVQRVWKILVGSLTLYGLETAREVQAREGTANALGEGLIDSLDVIGF